ncbi:hypothetical protein TWF569_002253 [Orbilia oligospora]|uniref:SnoaL-like domain-containing protein n=1 Tax=Orbilia oligospora TaxID=2813651 RepID=A0A7C8N380_ORBOL|nr:hypothetical protein TWF706_002322 [Orbilia oligospora]KAF3088350.1 hypothetical protein TWF102_010248 [Orbilia oligospora]KAF3095097.1 hypothetical protein TWF103_010379 [Orbilia oligospora]KAF3122170.1 hypothetical protein TWF569_002253 [Orbilia oligospora]KAF3130333.1 hypothetical protein TWF594_010395 [Orbilia oligospora]
MSSLKESYKTYIQAINDRNWALVISLVHPTVIWNQKPYPAEKYVTLMTRATDPAPDLKFHIDILVADDAGDEQMVSARLLIKGTPEKEFLGFRPTGKSVEFVEHVFYRFVEGKIKEVKTVIDIEGLRDQMVDAPIFAR